MKQKISPRVFNKIYKHPLFYFLMKRGLQKRNFGKQSSMFSLRKKRAQFFLLTAVIISAIVISLGITANKATITKQPDKFYDYSFNVKKEAGAVIDYEIFSNFSDDANLSNFVDLLAKDMRDRDPNLNFLFAYGDSSKMTLKNYGSKSAEVTTGTLHAMNSQPTTVSGANYKIKSKIKNGHFFTEVDESGDMFDDNAYKREFTDIDAIGVSINEHDFDFNISKNKQVIFIVVKEENNESYIAT